MCTKATSEYFCDKLNENSKDQNALFNITNKLLYRKLENTLPTHTSENQLAEEFAAYFQEKIEKIKNSFELTDFRHTLTTLSVPKLIGQSH